MTMSADFLPVSGRDVMLAVNILLAVAECIRTAERIPSGHLYAMLMDRLTLAQYETIIATLKRTGLVKEVAHELIWAGPHLEAK
jgi:hypothetical protein